MVQGQHGVGLAAAEVRLELNDGIASSAREAADGPNQQTLQAFRQIRAPEELDGFSILVCAFTQMHLPEIGGELGLLVASARDVPVGGDDFPPRLQAARGGAFNRRSRLLAPFSARLFVEAYPQQFQLALLELFGLRCGYRGKESAHRIQSAIGVIAGKTLLVCPLVAVTAQLADQTPLRRPQNLSKDIVPGVPHQLEQPGHVPLRDRLAPQHAIFPVVARSVGVQFS